MTLKPKAKTKQKGNTHTNATLTAAKVMTIRKLRKTGAIYSAIAKRFGVSIATAHRVCNGGWK